MTIEFFVNFPIKTEMFNSYSSNDQRVHADSRDHHGHKWKKHEHEVSGYLEMRKKYVGLQAVQRSGYMSVPKSDICHNVGINPDESPPHWW